VNIIHHDELAECLNDVASSGRPGKADLQAIDKLIVDSFGKLGQASSWLPHQSYANEEAGFRISAAGYGFPSSPRRLKNERSGMPGPEKSRITRVGEKFHSYPAVPARKALRASHKV